MTVYVDNMKTSYGCMKMCHMAADSNQELLEMVDKIGVSKKNGYSIRTHRKSILISVFQKEY